MPASTSTAAANRRLSIRRPAKRSTKISCRKGSIGLGPNLALTMLDLSDSGVRFLSKVEMKKGEEVEVGMMALGGVREVLRKGEVMWCTPTADGGFCLGVCFSKRLEFSMLSDLSSLPTT